MLNLISRGTRYALALFACALIAPGWARPAQLPERIEPGTTLAHLHAAYNGESNARARYLAFANKAAAEGYGQVASLFRAVARAEQVHRNNHAAVLRKMGAEPQAIIKMAVVKSTRENLEEFAMKGEAYERDVMYSEFIQQANLEQNADAARSFQLALTAEAEHFQLFSDALSNLENMRGAHHTYYVCPVCGYTVADVPRGGCVSCMSPAEIYVPVS